LIAPDRGGRFPTAPRGRSAAAPIAASLPSRGNPAVFQTGGRQQLLIDTPQMNPRRK
jgi:hypothetical protein